MKPRVGSLESLTLLTLTHTHTHIHTYNDECSATPQSVRAGIQGDPALASLFQHSACLRVQPASLVALCAQIIVDGEVDYHNNAELPDEVVKAIEKVRRSLWARTMV